MKKTKKKSRAKSKLAFCFTLFLLCISLNTLINSIGDNVMWKIVCSSIGFMGFVVLAILHIKELKKI